MDETEVQVEIACWAQDHPEASMINWTNGNEPWVTFEGKRCTVHVGLGGLTWSIEVPSGYQTEVDPRDGKHKRLWEPLDYHDVVIVQSKSTPFYVSVIDHAETTLCVSSNLEILQELSKLASFQLSLSEIQLGKELVGVGKMEDGDKHHQKTPDMINSLLTLQLREVGNIGDWLHQLNPGRQWPSSQDAQEATWASLRISNACFASLKAAETLAEVLDSIHILAKLYNSSHRSSVNNTIGAADDPGGHDQHDKLDIEVALEEDGDISECNEDDEHLFDTELAIKWSWISAQVSYAQLACTTARQHAARSSLKSDENESRSTTTVNCDKLFHHGVAANAFCPGHSSNVQEVESNIEEILDAFQVLQCDSDSDCSDNSWEMTDFCDNRTIPKAEDACGGVQVEDGASSLDGLSMQSQSKREHQEMHPALISSQQSEFPGTKSSRESIRTMPFADNLREPLDDSLTDSGPSAKADEESDGNISELQFCAIVFNPVSFSVECTIHLREFMDNRLTAAALGLSLDHPLRVEIVPKKADVDSLQWTGAVDVHVSQQTDWHNHLSEEICGLLCFVPYIVQKYLFSHLAIELRTLEEHKGDLFTGVLETIVRRLVKADDGNSCCVCARSADRPSQLYMTYKCLWPCTEDFCQATYAAWQNVSSVDSQERDRDERFILRSVEERLRDDFPYDHLEGLKSALHVYDVNTDQMNYGQLIRALANIELWDERDPDTPAADLMLFSEQGPVK